MITFTSSLSFFSTAFISLGAMIYLVCFCSSVCGSFLGWRGSSSSSPDDDLKEDSLSNESPLSLFLFLESILPFFQLVPGGALVILIVTPGFFVSTIYGSVFLARGIYLGCLSCSYDSYFFIGDLALGSFGFCHLGSLGYFGYLFFLVYIFYFGGLGSLGSFGSLGSLGSFVSLGSLGFLGCLGCLGCLGLVILLIFGFSSSELLLESISSFLLKNPFLGSASLMSQD